MEDQRGFLAIAKEELSSNVENNQDKQPQGRVDTDWEK